MIITMTLLKKFKTMSGMPFKIAIFGEELEIEVIVILLTNFSFFRNILTFSKYNHISTKNFYLVDQVAF